MDGCGYFMGGFNIHNLPKVEGWKPYSNNTFGAMLMDFACQYNMEYEWKNYKKCK